MQTDGIGFLAVGKELGGIQHEVSYEEALLRRWSLRERLP